MATLPHTIALAWALAVLMHWWPRLPALWRRRISLATSAAGIAFLVAALQAEGRRESALTSTVVVGPAVLTATASASASLYYYVLTAVPWWRPFSPTSFSGSNSRASKPSAPAQSSSVSDCSCSSEPWLLQAVRTH